MVMFVGSGGWPVGYPIGFCIFCSVGSKPMNCTCMCVPTRVAERMNVTTLRLLGVWMF